MLDFFAVPGTLEAALQTCLDAAGLPPAQYHWEGSPVPGRRRCRVVLATPTQLEALWQLVRVGNLPLEGGGLGLGTLA